MGMLRRARIRLSRTGVGRPSDDGFALVAAIGVAVVAVVLAMTVLTVAVRSAQGAGSGRDRSQAAAAAEAGIDATTAMLSASAAGWGGLCPPAGSPFPTTPLRTTSPWSPGTISSYRTVEYQAVLTFGSGIDASTGAVTGVLGCGDAHAAYVQVDSTGRAGTGSGTTQSKVLRAVLRLPAQAGSGILGSAVTLSDYAVLDSGTSGLGVRVATADGGCGLNTEVHADVVVSTGKLVIGDYCHVYGSVKAAAGVTMGFNATIDGSVLTKPGMPVVTGYSSSTGPVSTSANDPAWSATPLPRITETLDAWTARGYTIRPWQGGCSMGDYATLTLAQTARTIYDTRTACPSGLTTGFQTRIRTSGEDAVLLVNGFSGGDYSTFTSDTPTRRLWVIAPAPATGASCPVTHDITLSFKSGSLSGVKPLVFLYSACTVKLGDYAALTGQVWGGTVALGFKAAVTFADLGIPTGSGGSVSVTKTF